MTDTPAIRLTPPTDLSHLPQAELLDMAAAGTEVGECIRVLRKVRLNLVGEVLRGQGQFLRMDHYPKGDVFDPDSHAQYYYHAHRGGEHGHFHCFLRAKGMPDGNTPVADAATRVWPRGDQAIAHLVAISMDKNGFPTAMFTTNRWVTGETWYPAPQVAAMIDRFVIDHAYPSWPTNRWLTAMFRLFRPQIRDLIAARDRAFAARLATGPTGDLYEDRSFETLSEVSIRIEDQAALVAAALAKVPC